MKKIIIGFLTFIFCVCGVFASGCSCSSCGCGQESNRSLYEIDCELEGDTLLATQKITFYNSYDNSFTQLKFNLFANAFRKDAKYSPILSQHLSLAYPNGMSYGQIDIKSVSQEGAPLDFLIGGEDCNILVVNLKGEVFPEESVALEIVWELKLANVIARTGINQDTINLANFYPILCGYDNGFYECLYYGIGDPFFSECSDYVVRITADKNLVVAGGGKVVSTKTSNNKKNTEFSLKNARSFAMVLSSKFQTISAQVGSTKITYYYYDDQAPETSLKFAKNSIQLFNSSFGQYPYSTYSVVQTKFVQGGMEFPTITFISDNIEGTAYGEVIVHETAHQWWQSVVGNNEVEYGFLDEGLAEYSVVWYFENYPEHGYSRKTLVQSAEQTYRVFCSVVDKLEGKVNTVMLRNLGEFSTEYEYVNMAYIKPCIMYDYLRTTIGDQLFFKGLKKYYQDYAFANVKPYDIVGIYEKLGADTNGFFESFYQFFERCKHALSTSDKQDIKKENIIFKKQAINV